jgi:hypothetical protein
VFLNEDKHLFLDVGGFNAFVKVSPKGRRG